MVCDEIMKYIKPLSPIPTDLQPQGILTKPIRCVLFDIYGTLLISASGDIGVLESVNATREKIQELIDIYGFTASAEDVITEFFHTIKNKHDESKQKGIEFPEVDILQIWASVLKAGKSKEIERFAMEYEMIVNPVYPMPHSKETLCKLKENDFVIGIVSNAQFYTPCILECLMGDSFESIGFKEDLCFFSYRFGVAKPSLILFQNALDQLESRGINADETLYIGNDMLNDVLPAIRMGFKTGLFAGDARSLRLREDYHACKNISPDVVITELNQVITFCASYP